MTGIYDFVSEILEQGGIRLIPGEHQSESGRKLWESRFDTNPHSMGQIWDKAKAGGRMDRMLYPPELHWRADPSGDYKTYPRHIKAQKLKDFHNTHRWVGDYPNARWEPK